MNQLMKILRPESATESYADLPDRLIAIYTRTRPPRKRAYNRLVNTCTHLLLNEDPALRPRDARGRSGGIVNLHTDRDTIIVPDLHGRMDLILNLLFQVDVDNKTILEQLIHSEVQIVCVGDGMHAEARAAERWQKAREEFIGGYWRHRHMDAEMRESLGVMQMVMELKGAFPDRFHYLKGNHDNILNERGNGNYPFMKFALEGPMVTAYMHRFYGAGLLHAYADFERNLPLLAIGSGFLISHAEPTRAFERDAVLNYRERPDVVEGLTWTADGQADSNAVSGMLRAYLPPDEHSRALHFGGHRPIRRLYQRRARGRYVQIHNPERFVVARVPCDRPAQLERDVIEIPALSDRELRAAAARAAETMQQFIGESDKREPRMRSAVPLTRCEPQPPTR